MKSTFRILFYAKWEARDEAKMLPIYVRITINGTKARFSLKIRVSEKIWDAKSGRAIGHSHEALQANRYLDSVVTRINTIYYRLCEQSEAVTAQMVRDEFLGVKAPSKTLLSVFAEFNDRQENLIGVDITQSTFNKFDLTFRRLEEFLRVKRNRPDIPVSLVDRDFVLDFEAYLFVHLLKFLLSLYHIYGTMEIINLLHIKDRSELRQWLADNHRKEKCCWVVTYRGKCPKWSAIPYIEVVEEALCFGWIDSTLKRLPDGRLVQRLSPRRPKSHWTQLNLDRCMDLEDRGLMTNAGKVAFEKAFEYNVVAPDSEINQMIEDENKLRRPELYK